MTPSQPVWILGAFTVAPIAVLPSANLLQPTNLAPGQHVEGVVWFDIMNALPVYRLEIAPEFGTSGKRAIIIMDHLLTIEDLLSGH